VRRGTLDLAGPADTAALGARLASALAPGDLVALSGPLAAGKTSLARGVLAGLGLPDEAPSPSFALAIDYRPPDVRLPVLHVDLYRLDDARDLDELGLADARADAALLVEWPERGGVSNWPEVLQLALADLPPGGRRLTWAAPASWDGRWPPAAPR